jgi:hypothetical protein
MKNRPIFKPIVSLCDETNAVLRQAHEDACKFAEESANPDYSYIQAYVVGALAARLDKFIGKTWNP